MHPWLEKARSRLLVFAHDMLMIPVAWGLTYWMRFNLAYVPPQFIDEAVKTLPLVMVVLGGVYWAFGLYRGVWRFASIDDLIRILQAVLAGTTLLLFILFVFNRMSYVPRSLPVLFVVFQVLLLIGPRLLYRWWKDRRLDFSGAQRVLIVGAGRAGEMLVRDLLRNRHAGFIPVALVDDKARRQGGRVHGVPIRGTTAEIPHIAEIFGIDLILLAVPSARESEMRRLVELCECSGVPFRTVPPLKDLVTGQVSIRQLRPVVLEDLLGRAPVTLDWERIRLGLTGRTLLVTGAGGSIGSELCRQLCRCEPARLVLLDHGEFNLYRIETELTDAGYGSILARALVDVTCSGAIQEVFQRWRPQVVFHAAAYKHVPLLEDQVLAALHNNVLGTAVMAEAADSTGCGQFVLISTDKAVRPANVMGASKRFAERICQMMNSRSSCRFMTVRFGNVLGSAGSVVPRFQQQIECGGPVTVTHPCIERYFMTIPEACQLIMQACALEDDNGTGGEIFVLDMGAPVAIRYLAEQMIRLAGRVPESEIEIRYTGLRPGEKLTEELFYPSEGLGATPHPRILVANEVITAETPEKLAGELAALTEALDARDESASLAVLARVVPEWSVAEQDADAFKSAEAALRA